MMMLTRCGNCTQRDTPVVVAIVWSTSAACIRVVGNYPDCGEAFAAVDFNGDALYAVAAVLSLALALALAAEA